MRHAPLPRALVMLLAVAGCAAFGRAADPAAPRWTSRAVSEARGDVVTAPDGTRRAVRYRGWTTEDFGRFRTYAYDDARPEPPAERVAMPAGLRGDPKKGRALFMSRGKGPCTGCHLIPGNDVWPAGGVGPDLSTIGARGVSDAYLYQQIHDPRAVFPKTTMPPWGAAGVFSPQDSIDVVAFLQSLKGPVPAETDPDRNPATRKKPAGFGDNLDPTNNPGVLLAEGAEEGWRARGPARRACADCHDGGPATAMRGVATRYPRFVTRYARVMAIEDFLTVHAPETTGRPMPAESEDNLTMAALVKMASNGLPVAIDVTSPRARAALARGRASFDKRVGQRNHACADCHTAERGADKFLGGRLLADVSVGLTRHFPTWRTSQNQLWDMRKRFQWCMTPLGMNMLPADAVEYAELELYLTSFDIGKPISVPGIRH